MRTFHLYHTSLSLRRLPLCVVMAVCCLMGPAADSRGLKTRPSDAFGWRRRADACVARRDFSEAADAYRHASDIYAHTGDSGAAKVLKTMAERYDTQVIPYINRPVRLEDVRNYYTGKRLEPVYGAYIGAFVDREDGVGGTYMDENSQTHKDSGQFNSVMEKDHAVFFMYVSYGRRFPQQWASHLRKYGAAAQLVLTPENIEEVEDNRYLRTFASAAGRSGIPIFLRFAGEMNGDWMSYHRDPALYIDRFRTVARVFHEEAPNVAMVWCVNDVPEDRITRYYPGEDAVDWVGVNFYSVPYNNGDINTPAWWRNPADSLRFIYDTYAKKHPIMIGEYAASHLSRVDNQNRPDFAVDKIGQLYSALPRLYPRVKAVHWLSMNTFKYAMPDRQLNNYSLLDDEQVAAKYREMIASPYFLSSVSDLEPRLAKEEIVRLKEGEVVAGQVTLSAWVKSYEQRPRVTYYIGDKPLRSFEAPGAYEWVWDTTQLHNGPATLKMVVMDSMGKVAGRAVVHVNIQNRPT